MATIVLGTAGRAIGAAIGGPFGAAVGQAIGAAAGSYIDQNFLFPSNNVREGPRLENIQITSSTEGAPIARIWGRTRIGGQLIWVTKYRENKVNQKAGSKGSANSGSGTNTYTYSVSFAVALCEGPIAHIGRIWADGKILNQSKHTIRVHIGNQTQLADSKIEAVEGAANAPSYRGLAYIVFEDLELEKFGNRIPQITVEIVKPLTGASDLEQKLKSVTLIPASGEFVYGTRKYRKTTGSHASGGGKSKSENVNNSIGEPNLKVSLDQLQALCPNLETVVLVVAWFGDDLRCGSTTIRPMVETNGVKNVKPQDWSVAGQDRSTAIAVSTDGEGRPVYGGTPSDHVVVEAIEEIKSRGLKVAFYPFILMDIATGNGMSDPWGAAEQAAFPWRGRITCDPAPGEVSSVDKTPAAQTQVNAFFDAIWGYNNFIEHYAQLCADAGGVDTFLIGSEMRWLSVVRSGGAGPFPAVYKLKILAANVSTILGAGVDISYTADWSEYHSYRPDDGTGDVFFHLDDLWADANIDFVGIDNYLPLADWREGANHVDHDEASGTVTTYVRDYLQENVESGEWYDWYYASSADRDDQTRTAISDGAYSKPWVFRDKDLRNWWLNSHYDRPGGVESPTSTAWTGEGKQIRFMELGCPALDRGANQPNVFHDPKSSESALPYYSRGWRDDLIQRQYLEAMLGYWSDGENNPVSNVYAAPMIGEMAVWTWDARPWPDFPLRSDIWTDSANWNYGHWLSGRLGNISLARLVEEICALSGVSDVDVSLLYGRDATVPGFLVKDITSPRDLITLLANAYGFDGFESEGILKFVLRDLARIVDVGAEDFVMEEGSDGIMFSLTRAQETELPGRTIIKYIEESNDFLSASVSAQRLAVAGLNVNNRELPITLRMEQAQRMAERMLFEAWEARESGEIGLPISYLRLDPADAILVGVGERQINLRLSRIASGEFLRADIVRFDPSVYESGPAPERLQELPELIQYGTTTLEFLDIPLITGTETRFGPRLAVWQEPWSGGVNLFRQSGSGYELNTIVDVASDIGELAADFYSGPTAMWDYGNDIYLQLYQGSLETKTELDVLNGANVLAIENSDGGWEIVQFLEATLLAEGKYKLSTLLRGQQGTEAQMRDFVATGARVVVLDISIQPQMDVPIAERNLAIAYRYGPAAEAYSDDTYIQDTRAFDLVALRPYSPVHLGGVKNQTNGDFALSWIRRTRTGGDSWEGTTVPLGEDIELYDLQILNGAIVVRSAEALTSPDYIYAAADQITDFGAPPASFTMKVYQISGSYGRGTPRQRIVYD